MTVIKCVSLILLKNNVIMNNQQDQNKNRICVTVTDFASKLSVSTLSVQGDNQPYINQKEK